MNVNQHAGEVMGFPRVLAIYWGSAYGSATGGLSSLALSLDSFFTSILPTPYFGFLAEYSVNTPTFLGSVWLPHDPTQMLTLSRDDAKNTITAWLDSSLLPEVPGRTETNLLYVIFLSSEIALADAGDSGYHDHRQYRKGSGKDNLFFALIASSSQNSSSLALGALTGIASHELVEAFTDRSGNGWYDDDTSPPQELADLCDSADLLSLNGFILSSYWRNSVGRCLQQTDLTPRSLPIVSVNPFPVLLGKPTTFFVEATSPTTGANVSGTATIMQPLSAVQYSPVATFKVPAASPKVTLKELVFRRGGEFVTISPYGTFQPDDLANFEDVKKFALTDSA
jgi:hypothetical protein